MENKRIEMLLDQIVAAANSITVRGEQNMTQLLGICSAAREIWGLMNAPAVKEAAGDG